MSTPEQAAAKWANNFVANLSQVAGASGDVDKFAQGVAEFHSDEDISNAQDLRDHVEGTDGEARVNQILDDYDQNSETPSVTMIKRLLVERSDSGTSDASDLNGDELDNAVATALDGYGQKWQSNTAAAFGL